MMSPHDAMDPRDLHRQAVKEAAALARDGRPRSGSQRSVIYDDGVYRVRGSEQELESLSATRYLNASASLPPHLGRYGSKQSGLLSEVLSATGGGRGRTKLDLIMRNGRQQEDSRDDELSQSVRATRKQQQLLEEDARQTKKAIRK